MSNLTEDAMTTYNCKLPGCTNEARSRVGRYSYCADHQGRGGASKKASANGTVEGQIRSLATLARNVDKARAKAKKLTEDALRAKQTADEMAASFRDQARELLEEARP